MSIKEYQHFDEKPLTQLLQGLDIDDQEPSALLRQMREISTKQVLETLWSSKLPVTLQAIIAPINISLKEKAQTTDKIIIADRAKFETSAVNYDLKIFTVNPQTNIISTQMHIEQKYY